MIAFRRVGLPASQVRITTEGTDRQRGPSGDAAVDCAGEEGGTGGMKKSGG